MGLRDIAIRTLTEVVRPSASSNGAKQATLTSERHPEAVFPLMVVPRSKREYHKAIGDGLGSSVIMAPVQWIMRVFSEARPMMWLKEGATRIPQPEHKLLQLLERPNEHYDGTVLWSGTIISWATAGNSFWFELRDQLGVPRELFYTPHWLMEPKWPRGGNVFIDHYRYTPGGAEHFKVRPDDVVHFRHGINPRNTRLGLSPLDSVIREVFTDEEASNYTASMLDNMGVPGIILSPASEVALPTPEQAEEAKKRFQERFSGDRKGEPLVLTGPTKVDRISFSPQELEVGNIRDISEERVCANLGIPPSVVGFGTGLQQTKVGVTLKEYVRLAWTAGIIPLQRFMAAEIQRSLVPEFEEDPDRWAFGFDRSEVEALQETPGERAERLAKLVEAGIISPAAARREAGFEESDAPEDVLTITGGE